MKRSADPQVLAPYLRDESAFTGHAEAALFPADEAEVARCLRDATARGVPVTFSAARSSLTGAAIPEGGEVLVVPRGRPEDIRVDAERLRLRAPAGVTLAEVEAAARAAGCFFPPDPTSRGYATLGGCIACNASGARSYACGPVGAWVEGLRVVLATGEILELSRGAHPAVQGGFLLALERGEVRVPCPAPRPVGLKSATGYATWAPPDLLDLFIGSEGTLGYIVEATLRLERRVEILGLLAFWPTLDAALAFVERLQYAPPTGLAPLSVELFDRRSLELGGGAVAVPAGAEAALLLEQADPAGDPEALAARFYAALVEAGAPDDPAWLVLPRSHAQHEALRVFRHAVPEAINALARSRGVRKLGTDLAWPRRGFGTLPGLVAATRDRLADLPRALGPAFAATFAAEHGRPLPTTLDFAAFGHAGDNHLHVNLLPRDAVEAAAGRAIYDLLARDCLADGGALSAEHGIGKAKRAQLAAALPAETAALWWAIKDTLDPAGILGRGNLLPPR